MRSLMYGFGDDRNPANDTVNVMEEILIEYITDVVRILDFASDLNLDSSPVSASGGAIKENAAVY